MLTNIIEEYWNFTKYVDTTRQLIPGYKEIIFVDWSGKWPSDIFYKANHHSSEWHWLPCRKQEYTLGPGDYHSFTMAILSQNHWEIDITEVILASIKVIIEGYLPMTSMTIWLHLVGVENS